MTYQWCFVNLWFGIVLLTCWHTLCAGDEANSTDIHNESRTDDHVLYNASSLTEAAVMSLFAKYGQNGSLSFEGFKELLETLGLGKMHDDSEHHSDEESHADDEHSEHSHHHHHHHDSEPHHDELHQHSALSDNCTDCLSAVCLKADDLLSAAGVHSPKHSRLSVENFMHVCPILIVQLDSRVCNHDDKHDHHGEDMPKWQSSPAAVWGFSLLACVVISAVGLVAVAIIPVMHKVIYNHLLQFLVALAIGSLTGDALLHLLPHALIEHSSHDHDSDNDSHSDRRAVWHGLTTLGGIYVFFVVERIVGLYSERKRMQNEHRLKMRDRDETSGNNPSLLETSTTSQSKHTIMTSSLPQPLNDANDIGTRLSRHTEAVTSCEEILMSVHSNKEVRRFADDAHDEVHKHCDPKSRANSRLHQSNGGHHHSHEVPGTVAAVAWMVIVGDGFHNFADGLAIGSAFANSLTGGLSTSIAVFCHELPHELGDFAMLLNAGMSAKQALTYNCVSSVLCMLGMVVGVAVGNISSATSWIFALIAGLFLYIALVDMLPEMTSVGPKKGEHPLLHLALQNSGMLVGASIMLMIALFEVQLQNAFSPGLTGHEHDTSPVVTVP